MERYLRETPLLDFNSPSLSELIMSRGWKQLQANDKIEKIYSFVQNEILFGYNEADNIPASQVFADKHGQCNTKGTLLMALLRACNIPCRFHAFTIDKRLQKGAITGLAYFFAPKNIIHSWVEIWYGEKWINLEGFIIDKKYLHSVQNNFSSIKGPFLGYGLATNNLENPPIDWDGNDTYIQKEGINNDYGVYDAPDIFYEKYGTNISGIKIFLFKTIFRRLMNRHIAMIRAGVF